MSDFNLNQIAKENSELAKTGRYDDMLKGIREPKTNTNGNWTDTVKGIETPNDLLFGTGFAEERQKPSLSKQVNITEGYANVAGEWLRMFPTYKEGRDNAEYAAQNQSTSEKWLNAIPKWAIKTATATAGGVAGIAYGTADALVNWDFDRVSDNVVTNTLADIDEKINYQLPNYYKKEVQNQGFYDQMTGDTANFFGDKVLGGLAFTVGAIASEGIWAWATGGSSLGTAGARIAARWGAKALGMERALGGVVKYKSLYKNMLLDSFKAGKISKQAAIYAGVAGDVANLARFTWTSAGYEASVETLHFKKEARENFYNDFEKLNDRAPSEEDIKTFEDRLSSTSKANFLTNVALVGSSNLVTFGSLMGIKSPLNFGAGKFLDKKLFGLGTKSIVDDAGKVTYEVLKPTTLQKIGRGVFQYGKSPVVEGIYEEGLQGVTNKVANQWMEYGYNPENVGKQADILGMASDAMTQQYGTKEGWVENGIGMIIGALGGSVNARSQRKAKDKELAFEADFATNFDPNTVASKLLSDRLVNAARTQGFAKEKAKHDKNGNLVEGQIANMGITQTFFNGLHAQGENVSDSVDVIKTGLNLITEEEFNNKGIEKGEIEDYKKTILESYTQAAENFKTNRKFAEYMIGKNKIVGNKELEKNGLEMLGDVNLNEMAIQSLTWTLSAGESANQSMSEIQDVLRREVGDQSSKVVENIRTIKRQKSNRQGQITKKVKDRQALLTEQAILIKQIAKLNAAPKEPTEGNKPKADAYGKASERLTEVNDRITVLEKEVQDFVDEVNSKGEYGQKLEELNLNQDVLAKDSLKQAISITDVFNLEENVKKFKSLIDGIKESDPQKHEYLTGMIDEYDKAQELFDTYRATSDMIMSGKMKIESSNNWLSGRLNKNKSMDEMTKDWLVDILQKYAKVKKDALGVNAEVNEEEQINEDAPQKDTTVIDIANKLKTGESLTEEEKKLLEDNDDINKAVDKLIVGVVTPQTQEQKLQTLKERKAELEGQVVESTPTINNLEDLDKLSEQERQKLKNDLKLQIDLLADNQVYFIHLTPLLQDAQNIIKNGLITGAAIESTTNTVGSKGSLFAAISDIIDGKVRHRNSSNLVVIGIDKTSFGENKVNTDSLFDYLVEQYPNFAGDFTIPAKYNVGLFTNGKLEIIQQEQQKTDPKVEKELKEINKQIAEIENKTAKSEAQRYKEKIEETINKRYYNLTEIPNEYGELTNMRPTDAELQQYKDLKEAKKTGTKEFQALRKKLSNWKVLNSAVDDKYNSIAELMDIVVQYEMQEEVLNTKDEITQEDTPQISDDLNGSSSLYVPELLQNVTANAKVKKDENGNFRLSHILPQTIIDRLGGEVVFSKETKDIKKIKPDTTFTVKGIKFTYLAGGVISVNAGDFLNAQQALNLYIVDTKTSSWTYKDIYEVKGDQWVKKESDFKEERLKNDKEAIYNLKAEDKVTFHLYNENGYNQGIPKKDRLAQLQIIALDSKGKMVGTVKRMQGSVEGNFLAMREKALKLYEENPKASIISLGMSSKVKNVYLGTPQLNMQDGKVQNYNFNSKSAKQVLATGYILNGELTSSVEFSEGIDRTFVAKLSKGNQGKKIPFVVVKKGVYNIAYPVSMIKSLDLKAREFDFIISQKLSPQETILKINDAIQKNGVRVNKLTFDDINNQAKLDEVRKAFDTKQTFLSLEDFADKNYKTENLIADAKINIDIEDIDNAISDAKIRISFEQEDFTTSLTKEQEAEIKSNEEVRIKEQQKVSEELKNNGEKNNCN